MNKIQYLIIGAGPAGLAMAGRMRKAGLDFEIIEQSKKVGNTWHNHYDRLHLHTVKQWSHLPHLPFPADYPLYVSRQQLTQYFADYATHFKIQPHFEVQATAITKQTDGSWEVKTQNGKTYLAENQTDIAQMFLRKNRFAEDFRQKNRSVGSSARRKANIFAKVPEERCREEKCNIEGEVLGARLSARLGVECR